MDLKPSSSTFSRQSLKRKDAPNSTDSAEKKNHTIVDCPIALEVLQEVGCTTELLNSGKVLAWALDPTDPAFLNINKYVERSQEDIYSCSQKVKVLSILRIMTCANNLETGALPLDHDDDPKNKGQLRKMLWHRTKARNVPSILQNGLKLPKRNTPDPYFGDGIYFSDNLSYSLDYCDLSSDKEGRYARYLFLSDVLLDDIYKTCKLQPKAPNIQITKTKPTEKVVNFRKTETVTKTVESIQGCGESMPDPKGDQIIQGCIWPLGEIIDASSYCPGLGSSEFVVYETKKVIPKFLVKIGSDSDDDEEDDNDLDDDDEEDDLPEDEDDEDLLDDDF